MGGEVMIREFRSEEWPVYRALRLAALAGSPDAFGSTFETEDAQSASTWASRLASGVDSSAELPLCAVVDGSPIGLAWGRLDPASPGTAWLFQMWVSPLHRRKGAARRLIDAIVLWARANRATELRLAVTRDHSAAVRLYERAGFLPAGPPESIRPGSDVLAQPMVLALRDS